jgi:hypothetical protein
MEGGGARFTTWSGGKKRGPVTHALERGERLGTGSSQSRWRRATVGRQGRARAGGAVWRTPVGQPRKKGEGAWENEKK